MYPLGAEINRAVARGFPGGSAQNEGRVAGRSPRIQGYGRQRGLRAGQVSALAWRVVPSRRRRPP